jgi:hypothetical protein
MRVIRHHHCVLVVGFAALLGLTLVFTFRNPDLVDLVNQWTIGSRLGRDSVIIDRGDGLVEVKKNASRHPILELIQTSRMEWQAKVMRQSTTLEESVQEYRKRYGRLPPRGYNMW